MSERIAEFNKTELEIIIPNQIADPEQGVFPEKVFLDGQREFVFQGEVLALYLIAHHPFGDLEKEKLQDDELYVGWKSAFDNLGISVTINETGNGENDESCRSSVVNSSTLKRKQPSFRSLQSLASCPSFLLNKTASQDTLQQQLRTKLRQELSKTKSTSTLKSPSQQELIATNTSTPLAIPGSPETGRGGLASNSMNKFSAVNSPHAKPKRNNSVKNKKPETKPDFLNEVDTKFVPPISVINNVQFDKDQTADTINENNEKEQNDITRKHKNSVLINTDDQIHVMENGDICFLVQIPWTNAFRDTRGQVCVTVSANVDLEEKDEETVKNSTSSKTVNEVVDIAKLLESYSSEEPPLSQGASMMGSLTDSMGGLTSSVWGSVANTIGGSIGGSMAGLYKQGSTSSVSKLSMSKMSLANIYSTTPVFTKQVHVNLKVVHPPHVQFREYTVANMRYFAVTATNTEFLPITIQDAQLRIIPQANRLIKNLDLKTRNQLIDALTQEMWKISSPEVTDVVLLPNESYSFLTTVQPSFPSSVIIKNNETLNFQTNFAFSLSCDALNLHNQILTFQYNLPDLQIAFPEFAINISLPDNIYTNTKFVATYTIENASNKVRDVSLILQHQPRYVINSKLGYFGDIHGQPLAAHDIEDATILRELKESEASCACLDETVYLGRLESSTTKLASVGFYCFKEGIYEITTAQLYDHGAKSFLQVKSSPVTILVQKKR